jgi:hypothetical protein
MMRSLFEGAAATCVVAAVVVVAVVVCVLLEACVATALGQFLVVSEMKEGPSVGRTATRAMQKTRKRLPIIRKTKSHLPLTSILVTLDVIHW